MILLFYHIFGDLAIGGIKEFNKKIRGAKGRISSQFGMLVRTREWAGEAAGRIRRAALGNQGGALCAIGRLFLIWMERC